MAWSELICSRATAAPFAVPGQDAVAGAGLGGWLAVASRASLGEGGCRGRAVRVLAEGGQRVQTVDMLGELR